MAAVRGGWELDAGPGQWGACLREVGVCTWACTSVWSSPATLYLKCPVNPQVPVAKKRSRLEAATWGPLAPEQ